ncbi:ABC transporter permease [Desulforhabdus amnigena]|jgi:NitT/TauT family transport system permease protein|nr:ABC transporter permease subunit [Desulforhabdus amnigena]
MTQSSHVFKVGAQGDHFIAWGDVVVFAGIAVVLYIGVYLSHGAAAVVRGPEISLSPAALPWYVGYSLRRMASAYVLSFIFTMVYGSLAAKHRSAERVLLPILDILQSIPILSFLPVVLLSLTAILPQRFAVELAAVVLIFTSQVWNMTFAWYQSLITIPKELREAATIFGFRRALRFKTLELPFAAISLIWNSMMSWAGGWFFLMAAEIFTVGQRDFRLPGMGAYLQEAANRGDAEAITWGICVLVLVIVVLDQCVWRPLLAWSDRFKLEMVEGEVPPTSWFYDALVSSRLLKWVRIKVVEFVNEYLAAAVGSLLAKPMKLPVRLPRWSAKRFRVGIFLQIIFAVLMLYGSYRAGKMLFGVSMYQWGQIGIGLIATLLRVVVTLLIALAWTVPLGVAIGTNPRLAVLLQPIVQIAASVPATALFPVLLLFLLNLPGGLNLAAVLLMLMGTQWYLLFNIIAGAAVIPQDLKYATVLLHMNRWERWRNLILPALFPYMITGGIAASGGAWNASIVAEYAQFGGKEFHTVGVGALIAHATAVGDYPLLLAATLSMILMVVTINRLWWRRLYRLAEERYRME